MQAPRLEKASRQHPAEATRAPSSAVTPSGSPPQSKQPLLPLRFVLSALPGPAQRPPRLLPLDGCLPQLLG